MHSNTITETDATTSESVENDGSQPITQVNMTDRNKSSFALHQFGTILIFQAIEDITLKDGRIIPKGYVNATQMCVANGKRFRDWEKLKQTQAYIQQLKENSRVPKYTYFIKVDGDNNYPVGTWISFATAMILAQWLSPEFAVWAGESLVHVLTGDFKALTPEAEEAQRKLQEIWANLRSATKETFWFLADAIKWYYDENPRIEDYENQNYSEVFNCLNRGLFGKDSATIKKELGITKGKLNRDHFGTEALKRIEMIQRIAEAQVMHHGKRPKDAVKFAIAMLSYGIIDYKK